MNFRKHSTLHDRFTINENHNSSNNNKATVDPHTLLTTLMTFLSLHTLVWTLHSFLSPVPTLFVVKIHFMKDSSPSNKSDKGQRPEGKKPRY